MKPLRFFILFCLLALTSALSLPGVQAAEKQSQTLSDKPWVWPLAPEKPRIQHIKTFITPQDLGVKGIFAKLWEFIAGEDTVDRIISPTALRPTATARYTLPTGEAHAFTSSISRKKYDKFSKTKLGPLASPIGAALDADGLLYVSDSVRRRVFVFDGSKNKRVIGDDTLLRPTGIAVNRTEKTLYVVDTRGHRVEIFDLAGKRLFSFGSRGAGDGEFNFPTHVAIDGQGDVYVVDTLNFRVQIFDKAGKFLSKFGGNGTSIHDFIKPKGIAVDSEGHLWVSDSLRNSIQVFDRQGRLLLIFGRMGIERGQFNVPAGLFMDGKDRLYVADSYNYRMQMFQHLK